MAENQEAAEVALHAVDELAELSGSVEQLQDEVRDLQEQVLRRAAEFQNYKRRTEVELAQAASRGRAEAVLAMLDVFDDLKRSLDAADAAAEEEATGEAFKALNDGVRLVYAKFANVLAQLGVEPIASVGQPFDEELHDAMMQQPAPDEETPSGTVIAEIQPGYRMGDRILRHAQVIVAQ
ncbi:MAG: nucleotide exchange factor GrpE [Rubricoccaceae bacterium]|nr:nucleotide exchange factor GrpE [Rubricoccaceae bacterium]